MKESWWKRRIQDSLRELEKHINILEHKKRGETLKRGQYNEISMKYNIMRKGISLLIDELKQGL